MKYYYYYNYCYTIIIIIICNNNYTLSHFYNTSRKSYYCMMMIWDTEIVRSGDYSSVVSLSKLPSNITDVISNYHMYYYCLLPTYIIIVNSNMVI